MALIVHGDDDTFGEKGHSGKVRGVIKPPPEIRAVVDKTAQFVAKHGKEFEQKIIDKASGTEGSSSSKFNFMRVHDPYNAYYEFKIKEFEEGPPAAAAAASASGCKRRGRRRRSQRCNAAAAAAAAAAAPTGPIKVKSGKAKMNAIAMALTSQKKEKESGGAAAVAPPAFEFSLMHPTGLSAMDMDIIKLTAQYTAVSGKVFLQGLAKNEAKNPQFDFLKPTHMLFSYFTALVDAYSKVLLPSDGLKAQTAGAAVGAVAPDAAAAAAAATAVMTGSPMPQPQGTVGARCGGGSGTATRRRKGAGAGGDGADGAAVPLRGLARLRWSSRPSTSRTRR